MNQPSVRQPDQLTLLACAGVVLFGGMNAIAIKQTVGELAPTWSAALRFLVAAGILLAVVLVARRPVPRGRALGGAVVYGLVAFVGSFALIYPALRDMTAGTVMVLIALTPLFTFGLAIAHGLERFRASGFAGALLAVLGVGVVVFDQVSIDVPIVAILLVLAGTAFISEASVIAKLIPKADPFATNGVAMLTGGLGLLAVSVVMGEPRALPVLTGTWLAMAYLVVFGSIVVFGLFLFAVRRWSASAVSYTTLLMPFVTVVVGAALLGERVSPLLLLGGGIVLAGVYLGAFGERARPAVPASPLPECLNAEGAATARR